jgi:hypothetical protein
MEEAAAETSVAKSAVVSWSCGHTSAVVENATAVGRNCGRMRQTKARQDAQKTLRRLTGGYTRVMLAFAG